MKVALCGSTRFIEQYNVWNRYLTLKGCVVYSVAMVSTGDTVTKEDKTVLDLVHLRKILESECILVIDSVRTPDLKSPDGPYDRYIGDSTRREILWANMLGKKIYLSTILPINDRFGEV